MWTHHLVHTLADESDGTDTVQKCSGTHERNKRLAVTFDAPASGQLLVLISGVRFSRKHYYMMRPGGA
ncbi:hypothetical protein [Fuerstiella marisgermanici]|uniref:Uncharacterized protein n=1 Tax=Fuerstiella marisgermanici TaxID=1891926 RepID=A0A1P8WMJ2_9PLAN|nr:hypothetical protein [Fuerstiella marisgermanici]APZ95286.1 hypothetical protein Fuma_04942 [Fuerstiella marisgermanici]